MSQEIASAISKISAELTGDAQTMARLVGQPLVAYPGDCWLSPAAQVRVLGERVNLRYWLYETLTQAPVSSGFSLRALATCVSPDCVNPAHQARKLRQKPGRKPGQAPMQRSRSAVDVAWPDPATILMLMVLEPNAWPDECRTRCWEWTGPVQPMGIHRLPKLKDQAAHKAVWEFFNRTKLQGATKLKKVCRNEMCVNPTHLIIPAQIHAPVQPVHTPAAVIQPAPAAQEMDETLSDLEEDLTYMLGTIHRQEDLLAPFTRWLLNRRPDMHDMIRSLAHQEAWLRKLLVEDIRWTFL